MKNIDIKKRITRFGKDTHYEKEVTKVEHCDLCKSKIFGNGSVLYPYECECSLYSMNDLYCMKYERINKRITGSTILRQ